MDTWGIPRRLLGPKRYPDEFWRSAYEKALRISEGEPILAPERFDLETVDVYEEYRSDRSYAVIILHKDLVASLPISGLARLMQYDVNYENAVFLVLEMKPGGSVGTSLSGLMRRLFWRSGKKICFVHIPKTAGTTIVANLRRNTFGVRYFGVRREFLECRNVEEFNAVCGHFYFKDVMDSSFAPDVSLSVVRDPLERFISAVAHARRPEEDASTFGPSMKAMRELPLEEYVSTEIALREISAHSIYLGWRKMGQERDVDAMRENALDAVRTQQLRVFPADDLQRLQEFMQAELRFRFDMSSAKNVTTQKRELFSAREQRFIDEQLPEVFWEERSFVERLVQTQMQLDK